MIKPKASLIISTYSNDKYLRLVLDSVSKQTDLRFEVIVSEDAEHPHIKKLVENTSLPVPMMHITQHDAGWQKNKALNRAIEASNTDYFVFIDEDCLLHPKFMEYHLKFANDDYILAGKRIKLDPQTSEMILANQLGLQDLNSYIFRNFFKIKKRGALFVEEGLYINPQGFFGFIPSIRSMHQLKGCNMSFSRKAAYAINGFDEDYVRPAIGEDIDLTWRFQGVGFKLKSLRNLAVQYHLYHKENWSNQDENVAMMRAKQQEGLYVCRNGLNKTL